MERRQFVTVAGSTVLVGLAGCLHGGGGDDFGSPPAVVEGFYEAAEDLPEDVSGDELVDELDDYLHSESPWRELFSGMSAEEMQGDDRTLDSVEAEVTEEDLGADRLQQEFGGGFFNISSETIDTIAEDNALVEATITYEEAGEETERHFTAPEDGNWQLFL